MMIDARHATPEQVYEVVKAYALKEASRLGLDAPTEEEVRCIAEDESVVSACEGMMQQSLANIAGAAARGWFLRKKKNPPVIPLPPTMRISASTSSGASPLTVQFFSNASTPSGPMDRSWDFGDGETSTEVNPSHTYDTLGANRVFSVTCAGTNAGGSATSAPLTLTVTGTPTQLPPISVATQDKTEGPAPLTVAFNGSASVNRAGVGGLIHSWDFGDLNAAIAVNPVHTYTTPGTYYRTQTVEDVNGLWDTSPRVAIVVRPPANVAPVAVSSADRVSGTAPLTIQFSSAGTYDPDGAPGPLTRAWTFGDGGTSAAANPSHTYAVAGTFLAVLRAGDGATFSDAPAIAITVSPGGTGPDYRTFTTSADSRVVYVSSSQGSDANDGLTPGTAKQTIAAGAALMRHQFPDWLLLRRGDSWSEGLGHWRKSGRSATEPMLFGHYGSMGEPRPILRAPNTGAFKRQGGGGSPPRIDFLAFDGIEMTPLARAASDATDSGFGWLGPGGTVYVQDCHIHGWSFNVSVENDGNGAPDAFTFFRNNISNARPPGFPHSSGIYAYDVRGLVLEENTLDHNGWSETVPGAAATIFNHNGYMQGGVDGLVWRNNITARASSHGFSINTEVLAEGNVAIACAVGGFARTMGPSGTVVRNNIVTEGRDISPSEPRGVGLVFGPQFSEGPTRPVGSLTVQGNLIFRNRTSVPGASAIEVLDKAGTAATVVVTGNTAHNWGGPMLVNNAPGVSVNLSLTSNLIYDATAALILSLRQPPTMARWTSTANRFWSARPLNQWAEMSEVVQPWAAVMAAIGDTTAIVTPAPTFVDATRTVGAYAGTLGLEATTEAFLAALAGQRRGNWNALYTAQALAAYLRAGFVVL